MLATASKYSDVRAAANAVIARRPVVVRGPKFPERFNVLTRRYKGQKQQSIKEFMDSELREGRLLDEYLKREKARMDARIRSTARAVHEWKPNPKSDFKLVAAVPGRLYHRWRGVDKDFWRDDSNLKRLKRDNPDLAACIKI